MTDYDELVNETVDDVKDRVKHGDLDVAKVLAAEKANKNRTTLVGWLESQLEAEVSQDAELESTEKSFGNMTLRLNVVHALAIAFVFGAVFGGLATGAAFQVNDFALTGNAPSAPSGNDNGDNAPSGNDAVEDTVDMSQITLENQPVLGDKDAPVTMVIFEDFECPFCQRFEQGAMPQIVSNFVDTGQVKIVWKDLPLPMHPWAKPGAAAMECVYREDNAAFWTVKDKIFDNQNALSTSNVQDQVKTWAAAEGVSETAVQNCLDNDNPMDAVNADLQEAQSLSVTGTPTSIIDGKKVVGALPYTAFSSVIEDALGN